MLYKILYIIFCSSIIFSQSFFNRVLPEESYCGDAKSMAIGNTCLLTSSSSSVIISNPAKISSFKGKYAIDLNIDFKSLTERRSIIFKDEWEESLGETDYVFNQNNLFNHSFGLLFNQSFKNINLGIGIMSKPYLSFNYNYEEEVRGDSNLSDGVIGINDPIIGYHTYNTSGTMKIESIGLSFSFNNIMKNLSFGLGINRLKDTSINDSVKLLVIDNYYEAMNLANISDFNNSYLVTGNTFTTVGIDFNMLSQLNFSFSFEEGAVVSDNDNSLGITSELMSNIVGLPQLFDFQNDELTYVLSGFYYNKPEKKNLGVLYSPKSNINMILAFELTNKYFEHTISVPGIDYEINDYKLGFEYAPMNSYPIRAGLVYSESPFKAISPKSVLTLGTGIDFGKGINLDIAMNYSTFNYKYYDILPLEDIFNYSCDLIDCDTVTENNLSFLTTLKVEF